MLGSVFASQAMTMSLAHAGTAATRMAKNANETIERVDARPMDITCAKGNGCAVQRQTTYRSGGHALFAWRRCIGASCALVDLHNCGVDCETGSQLSSKRKPPTASLLTRKG